MTIEHKTITDPNIHEPKGASSASSGHVYVADGAGSGSWTSYSWANLSGTELALTVSMDDLSTADSVYVVSPIGGTITKVYSVIKNAITTADATVTLSIAGVTVVGGTITVTQSGSAAGDVDSCTPTDNNGISEGQALKITTDGGSTTTCPVTFTVIIEAT